MFFLLKRLVEKFVGLPLIRKLYVSIPILAKNKTLTPAVFSGYLVGTLTKLLRNNGFDILCVAISLSSRLSGQAIREAHIPRQQEVVRMERHVMQGTRPLLQAPALDRNTPWIQSQ